MIISTGIFIMTLFLVRHTGPYVGLVRRTFCSTIPISAKVTLYTSLIRSQVLYCSHVWQPHLIKDIKKLEQLQHQATKYILSDYLSDYIKPDYSSETSSSYVATFSKYLTYYSSKKILRTPPIISTSTLTSHSLLVTQ